MIVQRRCTSCCSSVENIPLQAERHSGSRQRLFGLPPESRSPSTGFPRRFSAILTLSAYELLFSFSSPKEKGQFLDLVRSNEDLETTTSKMTLWCPPLKRFGMFVRS